MEKQKMRLQYWKEHFSIKEILEGLGTYKNKLYALYKKHEITTRGHMQTKGKGKEEAIPKEYTPSNLQYTHSTELAQTQILPPTIPIQEVADLVKKNWGNCRRSTMCFKCISRKKIR
ncbi:hypothetical protein [Bacillus thuringiensis]|uniref:hypothetical protein n=1 Tax=Bacillus thuringiensis TaxID=1428 RepID=UPI001F54AE6D|nr:hypothetical protein [Bacillus thuringiensis]